MAVMIMCRRGIITQARVVEAAVAQTVGRKEGFVVSPSSFLEPPHFDLGGAAWGSNLSWQAARWAHRGDCNLGTDMSVLFFFSESPWADDVKLILKS